MPNYPIRHDWTVADAERLFALPFNDLLLQAQLALRENFIPNRIQASTLISIKTGSCPEDCSYCPQSAHYNTGLKKEPLMEVDAVFAAAARAKEAGASRFCMGAAWRGPRDGDLAKVAAMIKGVKDMGLETCATLGLLKREQAATLKEAGLDYYNHHIDTSEANYANIITTRTFQDRLDTLEHVRAAGMKTCCGGIVGMGETLNDRASMLTTLANLPSHPESVPINMLIRIPGTPMSNLPALDPLDFVRTIAVARVMMPASYVRLSAGREDMSAELQALCFFAGANSLFYGEKLLTAANQQPEADMNLLQQLGFELEKVA